MTDPKKLNLQLFANSKVAEICLFVTQDCMNQCAGSACQIVEWFNIFDQINEINFYNSALWASF